MSGKERKLRTVMLAVPGGLVPHIGRFTDEELEEESTRGGAGALFQRAAAGTLSGRTISRNREALLLEAVRADRPDMLSRLMPEKKRLPIELFSALTEASAGHPDSAAWLLEYRRAHYTKQDFSDYETHRLDLELGFSEPSVAELKKTLRLRYVPGGVCVCGAKQGQARYEIPARIGARDVAGVDAAAFYALDPMPRLTRAFSELSAPDLRGLKPGDTVYLGRRVTQKNAPERPMAWRVLEARDGRLLVLCEEAVAILPYHPELEEVTWEKCALRRWLNGVFLPVSFSSAERAVIVPAAVTTPDNTQFGTPGGSETEDYLFLMSIEQARTLLPSDEARSLGQYWWLRTPGFDRSFAAKVTPGGEIVPMGAFVDADDYAVRPAMWLRAADDC